MELLKCFDVVLNPRRLPDGARELGNHDDEQLNKLCHHFETVLDSNKCKNQFLQFKHQAPSYRAVNFEQFTSCLIQEYKNVHPDFVQLALVSLVISQYQVLLVREGFLYKMQSQPSWMMIRLVGPSFENVDFLTAARAFRDMKGRQKSKMLNTTYAM